MSSTSPDNPSPSDAAGVDPLARVARLGQLVDVYGSLLTERQRNYMQLHFEDDLSFGEIARQFNVSRQAIHDAVKHAEASLEEYESKLGLVARGVKTSSVSTRADGDDAPAGKAGAKGAIATPKSGEAVARLRAALDTIRQSGGVIYNTDGLAQQLRVVIDLLEGH